MNWRTFTNLGCFGMFRVKKWHISVFLRGFLLTNYDFRKSGKLWKIWRNSFWKASRFYFETLQPFVYLTLPGKRDKGIVSKSLMRNLPQFMIFCSEISEKGYFWLVSSLENHKFILNSRSADRICVKAGI